MKEINLTIDNVFRHPFRWGRCPVDLKKELCFGVKVSWGEMMPTSLTNRWFVVFYYGTRFKGWSNYPIQ